MKIIVRRFFRTTIYASLILLSACNIQPEKPQAENLPPFNPNHFRPGATFKLLPEKSEIRVFVYRGGMMAALGHNHIVVSHEINGKIYRHHNIKDSGVIFEFPVGSMKIDQPHHRLQAGDEFSSIPSEDDIAGTRKNMLSENLLFGEQYPTINVSSVSFSQSDKQIIALMRIRIKDTVCDIQTPFTLVENNDQIVADGEIEFSQQHCGLTPFSIMMGALAVKDKLRIKYHLTGKRI